MRPTTFPICVLMLTSLAACSDSTQPSVWSLGSETMTVLVAGTNGPLSALVTFRCPDGAVATGYQGRSGQLVDQIRLTCAPLNSDGTFGTATLTGAIGTSAGGTAVTSACPMDNGAPTLLVGDSGSTDGDIHQVIGLCRGLADVATGADNATATLKTSQLGGGPFPDSNPNAVLCPNGSAVTGIRGRYRTTTGYVDELGYFCRAVQRS